MAIPAPDANTVARFKFSEAVLGSANDVPTAVPVDRVYGATFLDDIGLNGLDFADCGFAAGAASGAYQLHVPGILGRKTLALFGGSASEQRDYAFGSSALEVTGALTFSGYVYPFILGGGLACMFGKDYRPANNNIGTNGLGSQTYSAPFVSFRISFGDNADGRWQVDWTTGGVRTNFVLGTTTPVSGTSARARIRNQEWNHVGVTHDGVNTLKIYLNGVIVHTATIGPIDYGTHGDWQFGGTAFKSSVIEHLDGQIEEVRVDNVVRDATWFEDMYLGILEAGGSTGPPVVSNLSPAAGVPINRQQVLQFDITDDGALRRALPMAYFPSLGIWELVHNGDAFTPQYSDASNVRTVISGGFRYRILRRGGWPSAPTLTPFVYDEDGNENS